MKTLIIGNSHVGAIIKAYKDDPSIADLQFLAVDGNTLLQNLLVNESCELFSKKQHITDAIVDQGMEGVSLNEFDCIMIYGCQLRAAGGGEHWINKIRSTTVSFSHQVRNAADTDFVHDTTHYRFLKTMSEWPLNEDVKVVSIPSPLPNELAPFCADMPAIDKADIAKLQGFIKNEIENLGYGYLDTPDTLLCEKGYSTKAAFKAAWVHDTSHLNTEGGHEVLNTIAAFVKSATDTLDQEVTGLKQETAGAVKAA